MNTGSQATVRVQSCLPPHACTRLPAGNNILQMNEWMNTGSQATVRVQPCLPPHACTRLPAGNNTLQMNEWMNEYWITSYSPGTTLSPPSRVYEITCREQHTTDEWMNEWILDHKLQSGYNLVSPLTRVRDYLQGTTHYRWMNEWMNTGSQATVRVQPCLPPHACTRLPAGNNTLQMNEWMNEYWITSYSPGTTLSPPSRVYEITCREQHTTDEWMNEYWITCVQSGYNLVSPLTRVRYYLQGTTYYRWMNEWILDHMRTVRVQPCLPPHACMRLPAGNNILQMNEWMNTGSHAYSPGTTLSPPSRVYEITCREQHTTDEWMNEWILDHKLQSGYNLVSPLTRVRDYLQGTTYYRWMNEWILDHMRTVRVQPCLPPHACMRLPAGNNILQMNEWMNEYWITSYSPGTTLSPPSRVYEITCREQHTTDEWMNEWILDHKLQSGYNLVSPLTRVWDYLQGTTYYRWMNEWMNTGSQATVRVQPCLPPHACTRLPAGNNILQMNEWMNEYWITSYSPGTTLSPPSRVYEITCREQHTRDEWMNEWILDHKLQSGYNLVSPLTRVRDYLQGTTH